MIIFKNSGSYKVYGFYLFFIIWELITQKQCIFDPMLVKPKCVWEAYIYFENCKQTAENCNQRAEKSK